MAGKAENKPQNAKSEKVENVKPKETTKIKAKPEIDITAEIKKLSKIYDRDYFENGIITKKSNYIDYSWNRLGSYFQRTAKHIVNKFSPASALDVGCAKGFLVKALVDLGVNASGIDPSNYAISAVLPDIKERIKQGIAQALPYEENLFDIVTCFDVLEHIHENEVPQVLSEMFRVTKQWLIIRVVTKQLPNDVGSNHATIHNKEWWNEKIKEAGGNVETTENYVELSTWWFNVPDFLIVARKVC